MDDTHHPLLRSASVPLHQTLGCLNMRLISRPSCPRAAWLRALSSAGTRARAYAGAHCLALAILISLSVGLFVAIYNMYNFRYNSLVAKKSHP